MIQCRFCQITVKTQSLVLLHIREQIPVRGSFCRERIVLHQRFCTRRIAAPQRWQSLVATDGATQLGLSRRPLTGGTNLPILGAQIPSSIVQNEKPSKNRTKCNTRVDNSLPPPCYFYVSDFLKNLRSCCCDQNMCIY